MTDTISTHLVNQLKTPVSNFGPLIRLMLLLFTIALGAETKIVTYDVKWQFIKIGEAELRLVRSGPYDHVSFSVATVGAMRVLREYDALIESTRFASGEWKYELKTLDRGELEERTIRYRAGETPIVEVFHESDSPTHLSTSKELDGSSVDPIRVLFELLRKVENGVNCNQEHTVYDGKRRYKLITVVAPPIPSLGFRGGRGGRGNKSLRLYYSITINSSSVESAIPKHVVADDRAFSLERMRSPFFLKDPVLNLELVGDGEVGAYPREIRLKLPVGNLILSHVGVKMGDD